MEFRKVFDTIPEQFEQCWNLDQERAKLLTQY